MLDFMDITIFPVPSTTKIIAESATVAFRDGNLDITGF
jgi:hypothetical protein